MYACCCVDPGDYETLIIMTDENRKARKEHVCGECGGTIEKGEVYHYESGVCAGSWEIHKTCWFCMKIREDFFECGWIYGQLREIFCECNGWDYVLGPQPDDLAEDNHP